MLYFHLVEEGEEKEKKKKRERETLSQGFPGPDLPFWLCHGSQLLGSIKG
jgi:hypothetical protein